LFGNDPQVLLLLLLFLAFHRVSMYKQTNGLSITCISKSKPQIPVLEAMQYFRELGRSFQGTTVSHWDYKNHHLLWGTTIWIGHSFDSIGHHHHDMRHEGIYDQSSRDGRKYAIELNYLRSSLLESFGKRLVWNINCLSFQQKSTMLALTIEWTTEFTKKKNVCYHSLHHVTLGVLPSAPCDSHHVGVQATQCRTRKWDT
jgi:hypothetical protein